VNKLKIIDVKKLDDGVSGITIEGRIIKTPGKPRESEYGWSQMIVLKDDSGDMGSWLNIEDASNAYKVGDYIKVKGKVSHYVKGGKPGISLNNGNVIDMITKVEDVSQEQQTTQPTQELTQKSEKVDPKVWEAKDLRTARESALKNIAKYVVAGLVKLGDRFDYAHEDVDFIYNGLGKITSEDITREFGGTAVEEEEYQKDLRNIEGDKEQKIARAKELVLNPHLADPIDDTMATVKQKRQVYGYINEEGKKIGGMVDSQYITKEEIKSIGKADKLTKANAIRYWDYWYGSKEKLGERDKRELAAKEKEVKEGNPFVTKRHPLEKRDPNDTTPLDKQVLIDDIQQLRKDNSLEDDEKFSEALGCNTKFKLWTEKELTGLKEKLKTYKPNWVTGNAK